MTTPPLSRRAVLAALAASPALLGADAAPDLSEATLAKLAAGLDDLAAKGVLSGVVTVAQGDRVVFSKAWGVANLATAEPVSTTTRFNLASMPKMFTALAIARLMEQGRLRLTDLVTRHLPDLPDPFARITLEHLLTHTSGLGDYWGTPIYDQEVRLKGRTVADYMRIVRADAPAFPPGQEFRYSNGGYVLLGAVIERLMGQDYFRALETLVYRPAGMRETAHLTRDDLKSGVARGYTAGCFARPPSACTPGPLRENLPTLPFRGTPAGGAYSTSADLLRFERALRTGRIVKPATLADMIRPRVPMTRPGGPQDAYGYGFGVVDHNKGAAPLFGHNGGTPGAGCQLDMLVAGRLTFVVLTNVDGAQRPVSGLMRRTLLPA